MSYIFVGLGNPGEEYEGTRHNTGRIVLEAFRKKHKFPEWGFDKKLNALVSKGKLGKESALLLLPETFMNKSGASLKPLITSTKKAKELVVAHDDLDLPVGRYKISFGKHSGGHRGVESIIKQIKTIEFTRVRIGISPAGKKGTVKKPHSDKAVGDFILGRFSDKDAAALKKTSKHIMEALENLPTFGIEKTMSVFNGR